jgi:serine phosphatase RsbU (regulator of sigma subunit)
MARQVFSMPARMALGAALSVAAATLLVGLLAIAGLGALERDLDGADQPATRAALGAAARDRTALRVGAIGVALALVAGALAWRQGRRYGRRIHAIIGTTEAFVAGRPIERARDHGGDELGVLAGSVDFMTDHLATVVARARERAMREAELEVIRAIQGAILPATPEIERPGLQLAGALRSTSVGGGDVWSVHALDGHRTMVVIGGASGHGVEAVLVTAAAKSACDAIRTARGAATTPAEVLEAMNAAVFQHARKRQVMTCFVSIVDLERRVVVHANAGHPFAYLLRGVGDGEFRALTSRGNRLGEVREARYETAEADLAPGDTLIWYTGGILACEGSEGEALGEKRFRAAIRRAVGPDAASWRDRVISECLLYYGAIPPKEDITMVIGRLT